MDLVQLTAILFFNGVIYYQTTLILYLNKAAIEPQMGNNSAFVNSVIKTYYIVSPVSVTHEVFR